MNHSALTTIFLTSIILATSQALLLGMVKDLPRKKCMPLDLKACSQLGYNKTHYHPHLYLSSRRTELFEYFGLLRLTRCSKDLLFYMCMVYQPICFHDYDEPIPPCKSVCEGVRSGCLDIITRYGFKWPEELNCKNLPDHQSGVCIKPSAIIKNRGMAHYILLPLFVHFQINNENLSPVTSYLRHVLECPLSKSQEERTLSVDH